MDEATLTLLKMIEGKATHVKDLSKQLTCYYTVTRDLLEQIYSNIVSSQTSSVGGSFDSYETELD